MDNSANIADALARAEIALDVLIQSIRDRSIKPDRSWRVACSALIQRIEDLTAALRAAP